MQNTAFLFIVSGAVRDIEMVMKRMKINLKG